MATYTIRGTLAGATGDGPSEQSVEMSFTRDDAGDDGLAGLVAMLIDHEGAAFETDPLLMADSVLIVARGDHERAFDLTTLPSARQYVTSAWPQ